MNKNIDWVDLISAKTETINTETNTVFRQNSNPINKLDIYYLLTGENWVSGIKHKDAIVTFSGSSQNLIVIPQTVIDRYIFNPLFKDYGDGYQFKIIMQNYEHSQRRVRIKYRVEADFLIATLCPGLKKSAKKIDLFKLPREYWQKVEIVSEKPVDEFIQIVKTRVRNLAQGKGIVQLAEIDF